MKQKNAKLRGRIVEKYGTITDFAAATGMTKQSISLKLLDKVKFTRRDIIQWSNMLEIADEQQNEYFPPERRKA